jgi:ParB/RepB/Spo0J family partition protein
VLQPIKVTGPHPDGRYLVLWGQRRSRASEIAGRATIPAIVLPPTAEVDHDGAQRSVEQLVENLHRADLNPIDRAQAMRAVVDAGTSQADLARTLGIAPSTVSNDLRLLTLAEPVIERIRDGAISASHGKAMASLPPAQQSKLAERIVGASLSSKDLERELEVRRAEVEQDAAKAARTEKILPKAIAALEAAAVAKDAAIYASGDYYSMDVDRLRRELVSAGWTGTDSKYLGSRPEQGKCDCTAVHLHLEGRTPKVTPACSDQRHGDRQRNIDHGLEEEARNAFEARKVAVQREIERQLRASGLHPLVLELLRKTIDTYGATPKPDRDVIGVIALAVVQTWRVREAMTPELLAELGIAEASA